MLPCSHYIKLPNVSSRTENLIHCTKMFYCQANAECPFRLMDASFRVAELTSVNLLLGWCSTAPLRHWRISLQQEYCGKMTTTAIRILETIAVSFLGNARPCSPLNYLMNLPLLPLLPKMSPFSSLLNAVHPKGTLRLSLWHPKLRKT